MTNNVGQALYAYERQNLLEKLGDQVYCLKFHPKDNIQTLTALGKIQPLIAKCLQMAVTAEDTEFEKVCRDLEPVVIDGIESVRKDESPKNQLEFARQIQGAVPLALRDPTAHARAQVVHRYEVVPEEGSEKAETEKTETQTETKNIESK